MGLIKAALIIMAFTLLPAQVRAQDGTSYLERLEYQADHFQGAVSDRVITDHRVAPAGMPRDVQALNRMNAQLRNPPLTRKQVFDQRRQQYPPDAVVLYPME